MGRMEGKSGREAFTEFKAKFWQVYKVNLVITNNSALHVAALGKQRDNIFDQYGWSVGLCVYLCLCYYGQTI